MLWIKSPWCRLTWFLYPPYFLPACELKSKCGGLIASQCVCVGVCVRGLAGLWCRCGVPVLVYVWCACICAVVWGGGCVYVCGMWCGVVCVYVCGM